MTEVIHTHLAERDLLPSEQLVDTGYVFSDHLVTSNEGQIALLSSHTGGFELADACGCGLWRGLFYD